MKYTEVKIFTKSSGIDILCVKLSELSIEGFIIEDAADFQDFLNGTELYWDYVDEDLKNSMLNKKTSVSMYIPDDLEGALCINAIKQMVSDLINEDKENIFGSLDVQIIGAQDSGQWENNWKKYFKPFNIGEKFIIKPSWEKVFDNNKRMILEIDPASSFGTGSHETTRMCIQQLEKVIKKGDRVLDMGSGSGILSIACGMLGAEDITAVDIDRNSAKTSIENAKKNGIDIRAFSGNVLEDDKLYCDIGMGYDVICANIVADIIISMAPMFREKLKSDGILVTSGIIDHRSDEAKDALETAGFSIINHECSADWHMLCAQNEA